MPEQFTPSGEGPGRYPEMGDAERTDMYRTLATHKAPDFGEHGHEAIDDADRITLEGADEYSAHATDDAEELKGMYVSQAILNAFQSQFPEDGERAEEMMFYALDYLKSAPENASGVNIDSIGKDDTIRIYKDSSDAERWKLRVEKPGGVDLFNGFLFPLGVEQKQCISEAPAKFEEAKGEFMENPVEGVLSGSVDGILQGAEDLRVRDRVIEDLDLATPKLGKLPADGPAEKRWALTLEGTDAVDEVVEVTPLLEAKAQIQDAMTADNGNDTVTEDLITEQLAIINDALSEINNEELKTQVTQDLDLETPHITDNADYTKTWTLGLNEDGTVEATAEDIPQEHTDVFNAKQDLLNPQANGAQVAESIQTLTESINLVVPPADRDALVLKLEIDQLDTIVTDVGSQYDILVTHGGDGETVEIQATLDQTVLLASATAEKETLVAALTEDPTVNVDAATNLEGLINEMPEDDRAGFAESLGIPAEGLAFDTADGLPYLLGYESESVYVALNEEQFSAMITDANEATLTALSALENIPAGDPESVIALEQFPNEVQALITETQALLEKTPEDNLNIWDPYGTPARVIRPNYGESLNLTIDAAGKNVTVSKETAIETSSRESIKTLVNAISDGSATQTELETFQAAVTDQSITAITPYFSTIDDGANYTLEVTDTTTDTTHTINIDTDNVVTIDPELAEAAEPLAETIEQAKEQLAAVRTAIEAQTDSNLVATTDVAELNATILSVEGEQRAELLFTLMEGGERIDIESPGTASPEHKIPWSLSWDESGSSISIELNEDALTRTTQGIDKRLMEALDSTDNPPAYEAMQTELQEYINILPDNFNVLDSNIWQGGLSDNDPPNDHPWYKIDTDATDPDAVTNTVTIVPQMTDAQKNVLIKHGELETAVATDGADREAPLQALNTAIQTITDLGESDAVVRYIYAYSELAADLEYSWDDQEFTLTVEEAPTDIEAKAAPVQEQLTIFTESLAGSSGFSQIEDVSTEAIQTAISGVAEADRPAVLEHLGLTDGKEITVPIVANSDLTIQCPYILSTNDAAEVILLPNMEQFGPMARQSYDDAVEHIRTEPEYSSPGLDTFNALVYLLEAENVPEEYQDALYTAVRGDAPAIQEITTTDPARTLLVTFTRYPDPIGNYLRIEEKQEYTTAAEIPLGGSIADESDLEKTMTHGDTDYVNDEYVNEFRWIRPYGIGGDIENSYRLERIAPANVASALRNLDTVAESEGNSSLSDLSEALATLNTALDEVTDPDTRSRIEDNLWLSGTPENYGLDVRIDGTNYPCYISKTADGPLEITPNRHEWKTILESNYTQAITKLEGSLELGVVGEPLEKTLRLIHELDDSNTQISFLRGIGLEQTSTKEITQTDGTKIRLTLLCPEERRYIPNGTYKYFHIETIAPEEPYTDISQIPLNVSVSQDEAENLGLITQTPENIQSGTWSIPAEHNSEFSWIKPFGQGWRVIHDAEAPATP